VEGNTAGIKDMVTVVTGGSGSARTENVVAAAAGVVHEGVAAAEATGIGATGDNAIAVKNVASGIVNDVAVANVVSPKIRKRTAVADAAGIGATGVTACTVAADTNLVSVIDVVIANTAVSAEVVVMCAVFGVAVVTGVVVAARGVVVNAVVVVVVAVGNLHIKSPQLHCLGLGHFCIVCFLLFMVTIRLDFGNFCFGFGGFRWVGRQGSK
jgi:hypothetical protein